jgi:hypothetical protein
MTRDIDGVETHRPESKLIRVISLNAPTEVVKQIIVNIEAGVEVEVTIAA